MAQEPLGPGFPVACAVDPLLDFELGHANSSRVYVMAFWALVPTSCETVGATKPDVCIYVTGSPSLLTGGLLWKMNRVPFFATCIHLGVFVHGRPYVGRNHFLQSLLKRQCYCHMATGNQICWEGLQHGSSSCWGHFQLCLAVLTTTPGHFCNGHWHWSLAVGGQDAVCCYHFRKGNAITQLATFVGKDFSMATGATLCCLTAVPWDLLSLGWLCLQHCWQFMGFIATATVIGHSQLAISLLTTSQVS